MNEIKLKGLKLTTLAIIGSGIAGRSLIYTLAKEKKSLEKLTIFSSDLFAFPCSLNSTAIVAPRGLSSGHSPLGDLLMEGFETFKAHVELDKPQGIFSITQYTGATTKLDTFKGRYPKGSETDSCEGFKLQQKTYIATEEAYLIDPTLYLNWLMSESTLMDQKQIEVIPEFVTEVVEEERIHIKTQSGRIFSFDKVIFTTGSYSSYWTGLAPESLLKTSKPVQGSYLEFNQVELGIKSFSLTLDGHNLIWNAPLKRLLIGSTSIETNHLLAPMDELKSIYEEIVRAVNLEIPPFSMGEIKVGLREKAQKRRPYLFSEGKKIFLGGFYKNGYSLSLKMAKTLSHQFL